MLIRSSVFFSKRLQLLNATESFILITAAYAYVAATSSPRTLISADLWVVTPCLGVPTLLNVPCGHHGSFHRLSAEHSIGLNSQFHPKKQTQPMYHRQLPPTPRLLLSRLSRRKRFLLSSHISCTANLQGQMEAQSWPPLWADLACFWMVMDPEDPGKTNTHIPTHTHTQRGRPSVQKGLLEVGHDPRPARSEEMELIIIKGQTNPVGLRGQEVYPRLNEEQVLFKLIKVNQ